LKHSNYEPSYRGNLENHNTADFHRYPAARGDSPPASSPTSRLVGRVSITATVTVFKFNETGPVTSYTERLARKLGFVGTVRGRLPVGYPYRAAAIRSVTAVTDWFTANLQTLLVGRWWQVVPRPEKSYLLLRAYESAIKLSS
jgi:hypothetical protein